MSMNWQESARGASAEQRAQFAPGIAKAQRYLDRLARQGEIPQQFTPDKPKLHPFLEGKVGLETLTVGGKTAEELLQAMGQRGVKIGNYARSMVESPAFKTSPEPRELDLVVAEARVLVPKPKGNYPTTQEIFEAAEGFELDKVPAEAGPHYRLSHMDQALGEWRVMGMDPITVSDGSPDVFGVEHFDLGLWLSGRWTEPGDEWRPASKFVFSLRK